VSRITAAWVRPYALPLARPWRMAGATVVVRHGWLVRVSCADGVRGFGDAPRRLPDQAEAGVGAALGSLADRLIGRTLDDALAEPADRSLAGAAIEGALLDARARVMGVPLARMLDPGAAPRVAVNAVATIDGVAAAVAQGFRVIKIKVGAGDPAAEAAALGRLDLPAGVRLRLDANRAWSVGQAELFLAAITGFGVDSLEEPLAAPDLVTLARLQAMSAVDLAIDESLEALGADALIASRAVRRLVLKPAWCGGLRAAFDLAGRAGAAGLRVVVTTALDSAVGVMAAAHLAAAIDPRSCTAHGLSTGAWLAEDVGRGPQPRAGMIDLAAAAGLGFDPCGFA
jgi:o-succinylbenzoate synthase